jgi:hypothetical protein
MRNAHYNKLRSVYFRITAPNPYDSRTWTGGDALAARKFIEGNSYVKYPPGDPLIGDQQIQLVTDFGKEVFDSTAQLTAEYLTQEYIGRAAAGTLRTVNWFFTFVPLDPFPGSANAPMGVKDF